jgi:hypothetical protein
MQVLHLLGADLFWIALIIASEEALVREPRAKAQQSLTQEPLVSSS